MSIDEVPDYLLNAAEYLLNLWPSSSVPKVETLISIIWKEKFELNTFREHVSSVADSGRISNGVWKRVLLSAGFEPEEMNVEKNMLCKNNPLEVLRRQLQISTVDDDMFF